MVDPPRLRGGPARRAAALVGGLAVFAAGIVLQLESGLGLGPSDVLNQGLSERTPLSFGAVGLGSAFYIGAAYGAGLAKTRPRGTSTIALDEGAGLRRR